MPIREVKDGVPSTNELSPPTVPATVAPRIPLLPYQFEDVFNPARFRWNCWARQTGKSFTKSLRRLLRGLTRRRDQIFLSAGERQCRELLEKVRMHCRAMCVTCDWFERGCCSGVEYNAMHLVLPYGVRIFGLPANPLTARGYTGDVLLDEFAMVADDREIWSAMLPTLLRGDGELDVASTPRGKGNVFYELQFNPSFSTSTLTLHEAIANGLKVDAVEMKRAMHDNLLFRQEFLCEFIDGATAFLTYEQIDACVDESLKLAASVSALAQEDREMFIGVDIGRVRDLTVVWVLARDFGTEVTNATQRPVGQAFQKEKRDAEAKLVTVGLFELSQATFQAQYDLIAELMRLRQVRKGCVDATGLGMQLGEQLLSTFGEHRIEPVVFTANAKSEVATGLRLAVESTCIRIPDDERIRKDWHSVERTISESGNFRLVAPRREGSHADRFWAAALAVRAAAETPATVEAIPARPLSYAKRGTW